MVHAHLKPGCQYQWHWLVQTDKGHRSRPAVVIIIWCTTIPDPLRMFKYSSWVMSHIDLIENHKLTHQMLSRGQNPNCWMMQWDIVLMNSVKWAQSLFYLNPRVFDEWSICVCSPDAMLWVSYSSEYISEKWEISLGRYLALQNQYVPSVFLKASFLYIFFFFTLNRTLSVLITAPFESCLPFFFSLLASLWYMWADTI